MLPVWACIILGVPTILLIFAYFVLSPRNRVHFNGKHAFITGGSKGIGKEIAVSLIRRGCCVSIVARDKNALKSTCDELNSLAKSLGNAAIARWYELDMTDTFDKVESVIREAEKDCGMQIDILINNAGVCIENAFDELSTESFQQQFTVNCLSAIKSCRAVVKQMKRNHHGHIGFVCSIAGQFALYGYSAYSMSKFAMRGFAESLRMELLPYGIGVSILYPPDTDTDGYKVELQTMPEETREISGAAGLFTPQYVAECYVNNLAKGYQTTSIGLEGWMMTLLATCVSMEDNAINFLLQVLLLGPFRCVILFYINYFNKIVEKCRHKREALNNPVQKGGPIKGDNS